MNLAVIPGDGIGQEVTPEALKVLEAAAPAGVKFEQTRYEPRCRALPRHRRGAAGLRCWAELRDAGRHPARRGGRQAQRPEPAPGPRSSAGLLLKLRFELDHYVNLRPIAVFPGAVVPARPTPGEVDFVVVREGTEGPYTGNGGALRVGTPAEVATEVSVNTAYGVERVVRDAFARAQRRPRKKLTLVHKTNVLVHAGAVWWRIFNEVARGVPRGRPRTTCTSTRSTIFMVTDPSRFDVIVTDNLFGDIITDLARRHHRRHRPGRVRQRQPRPDRAEHVRARARLGPDIAGQQKADPTAAILSAALLLDHLGYPDAAAKAIDDAVVADLAARTPGAARRTSEIGDAIAARVAG